MPRWTSDIGEIRKLAGLPDFIRDYGFKNCRVFLEGSVTPLEGMVLPARGGNNAGEGGRWEYYGSIAVRTPEEDIEVDYLDVDRVQIIPDRKASPSE